MKSIHQKLQEFYDQKLKDFLEEGHGEPVGYQRSYFNAIDHIKREFEVFENGDGMITIEYLRGLEETLRFTLDCYSELHSLEKENE